MSPKLNWATRTGALRSAVPCTALTHAATLRSTAPAGVTVTVVNERLIRLANRRIVIEVIGR